MYYEIEFQSFKNVEELYLDDSVVDEKFLVSLNALPSLKKLSYSRGYGLDNLQGKTIKIYFWLHITEAKKG